MLVYSIYDFTEIAIQKMIDASQRMIRVNSQGELGGINPAIKRHLELEIKTLQNAPRDPDKLELLLKRKEREKKEAMYMEYIQKGWLEKRLKCSRLYFVFSVQK
jgi:hypothetical protein